ncbi:MAG: twin-arginine translocase TatA/TatE family subunit [Planctomycetes bacterium]|nr:twin-arginine translocase TatA/TatE family subunit [Planctomycetota bacterium]
MTVPIATNLYTLAFGLPGHMEWIVLLVLGLLIFGKRLPEVGRSIGRSIVEFKKGIRGIEDEIETESSSLPDNRPGKIEDQAATRKAPEESQPRQEEKKTEEIASSESERTES